MKFKEYIYKSPRDLMKQLETDGFELNSAEYLFTLQTLEGITKGKRQMIQISVEDRDVAVGMLNEQMEQLKESIEDEMTREETEESMRDTDSIDQWQAEVSNMEDIIQRLENAEQVAAPQQTVTGDRIAIVLRLCAAGDAMSAKHAQQLLTELGV